MVLSFASLPLILLMPQKFALVFTTGSVCVLGGLCSLKGTADFTAHCLSTDSRPLTAAHVGSMAGTLWACLWHRSALLTMVFVVVQICALIWFFVSYIPGGTTVLQFISNMFCGAIRRMCCKGSGGSLPL